MQTDYARAEAALAQAELRHAPAQDIEKLQAALDTERSRKVPSYAQYGRHFTQWDGYRYEEIITDGYIYHHPYDPESLKDSPTMIPAGSTEPRLKNIVWYPLFPLIGGVNVRALLHIAPVAAITVVSQTCALLSAIVLFLLRSGATTTTGCPKLDSRLGPRPDLLWTVVTTPPPNPQSSSRRRSRTCSRPKTIRCASGTSLRRTLLPSGPVPRSSTARAAFFSTPILRRAFTRCSCAPSSIAFRGDGGGARR